ncbi:formate-dependent phosphoribosylglycinamide formyltransferase [Sulfoacidibacillus thermotolerans]|uniref:Formate-dependent phosphoribosylglycinamide formyltransferase n=1 Tax=Sulfoacidibacillus thermotolerans TaxID=1765684 RepID=A0A2U3D968_SULT2|nr:formate-dependent phosphoribosylglycinamide formyltransferase [Sulfoacidibacillus thermotolerans]PWI57805.1 phosphoribosylglycinamide formyltransferase 2 [Sulfoacidibacillus thermotolerans]
MYGPPYRPHAKKLMILGAGELGKEVLIEAQRLGVETIAVDRYEHAPAMQVAHRSYVIDMLDASLLRDVILREQPDLIVPEIEAIATSVLIELENDGFHVIPTANATRLTMDREGIRRLAAESLHLRTARFAFANSMEELHSVSEKIGFPCVIKPIMSSSGKGQSICHSRDDLSHAWQYAMTSGRAKNTRVIVEEFIHFDSEITLLTVRSISGTAFCEAIGHRQADGDYIESWQPHFLTKQQQDEAKSIAKSITDALGGFGVFGVELFIAGDQVFFSEVSPRPHDTGLVTLITQNLSEFALHIRAILGFPIPTIELLTPGASHAIKAETASDVYEIAGIEQALAIENSQLRIFGKPNTTKGRRIAVALASSTDPVTARQKAAQIASKLRIISH